MFGRKKKKKEKSLLSCPFCGGSFEDVSEHIAECPAVISSNKSKTSTNEESLNVPQSLTVTKSDPAVSPRESPTPISHSSSETPEEKERVEKSPNSLSPTAKTPIRELSPRTTPTKPETLSLSPRKSPRAQDAVSPRKSPRPQGVISPRKSPRSQGTLFHLPSSQKQKNDWKRPDLQRAPSKVLAGTARTLSQEEVEVTPEVLEDEKEVAGSEEDLAVPEYDVGLILYSYDQVAEVEISVTEGQTVYILDTSDADWTYVGFDNKEGFVPSNYIQVIESQPAYSTQDVIPETQANSPSQGSTATNLSDGDDKGSSERVKMPSPNVPQTVSGSSLERPAPHISKGRKSAFGSISSFGSTLRSTRKKKKGTEFTIARADTPTGQPSPNNSPSMTPVQSQTPSHTQEEVTPPVPKASGDQRTNIANEILSTEQYYVNIIESMISRYREVLLYRLDAYSGNVTKEQINEIFSNLEMIIPINKQLCEDIKRVVDTWSPESTLGDIFVRVAPFMKMYNQYSNRYDQALATLTKCMKNEEFQQLVEEIDGTAKLGSRLESLLIAPIQRIPRYSLLLQELRKATPEGHKDIELLDKAIPLVQQVANYINSNISQVENQEKLLSLSLAGAQSLLKPHRVLLHEGILLDGKKKVHIWLFNDIVVQVPDNLAKNKENLNKTKYQWPLHLVWLGESSVKSKTQATFGITGPTRSYTFTCLIEEIQDWMSKIEKAIRQHLEYVAVTQDAQLTQEKEANMTYDNANRFGTFQFPNGATYTGWWQQGEFEGSGTFEFFGSVFVGTFSKNLKQGKGVLNYVTGEVYEGEWKNDRQNGHGVLTYPNGDVYDGIWLDGMKHGKGSLKCVLGDSYVGEWANDHPQGLGEMAYRSGQVYNGNWENGLRHHYGILACPSGEHYEGEWVSGVRHGKGRMEYFEGCFYDGYWKDGYKHGKGTYTSPAGHYDGEWVTDMREGNGTMTYSNGKVYKGQWKRDYYHGNGTLTYPSGVIECYIGDWVNQKRHGSGILRLYNGDMYEGHFKENRFHGTGSYSFGNGNSIKCKWAKGHITGECTFTKPGIPGQKKKEFAYTGIYKDGMIIAADRPPLHIRTILTGEIDL